MKLTELFLNRFLYKDNKQSSATKDSAFVSADSSEQDPPPIPSGGAAQDINEGNVDIDGNTIIPGSIPATTLDVSNWGWGQTCIFSSTDINTVSWGAGTFTSANGIAYAISAGNTGNMTAKTYIYLDLNVSATVYQITTTSSLSVGVGKVLVAVAENDSPDATFNLSEANQIIGDNILANTIDASKMNVGQLSAITADIGTINSVTITGGTIRTSLSGKRVQMTTSDYLQVFDASRERMRLDGDSLEFFNTSGATVGQVYTTSTANMFINTPNGGSLYLNAAGSSYTVVLTNAGNTIGNFNTNGLTMASGKKIVTGEVDVTYVTDVNTIRFTSTASPLTDNGSIYYSGSHFYGRIGGSWIQLDN